MKNLPPVESLLFILGAVVTWGVYVPTVHMATQALKSNLRAFLFVGIAYFIVAIIIPSILIFVLHKDPTEKPGANFGSYAMTVGLIAGLFGAAGALCVIFAANTAGKGGVIYVAPLVFAGAPIVNTIATITYFHPVKTMPDWQFFVGLLMAALGAALVMIYKPTDAAHGQPPAAPPTSAVAPAIPGGEQPH